MSYSALFTAGLLEHVERSPSPGFRSADNTPTPSRSVTPTRLPAAASSASHLRSFLSIEPESARPESFRTGFSRLTRDRSDSTASTSTSSSFVESPITDSIPSTSSLPPVLPPLSPRALSPLSFYEPTPSPKAPALPRTSTSSPIPRVSTASPHSRRRSLPEPKPAPSALLPPSPPPESTIYTRSASFDARRTSVLLADLDIALKSPLFVPLRIQSDPISPTSEDLYSLRTVSTNYKRAQRSDALARLEANAHIRSFFDDDTDASILSGKTKYSDYSSVALSIQPRKPSAALRVDSSATDRRRERKKAEVVLKPVRARETWSKTFLDLGDESVWSYRSRSTPISAV